MDLIDAASFYSNMAPTVLITGASQGIGKATALLFARKGYDLVLAARQPERFSQPRRCKPSCSTECPHRCEGPDQVNTLVHKALEQYGAIDVLVNNAGIYISGPVEQFSLSDWHQTVDTIFGVCPHNSGATSSFPRGGTGTIVNLSSIGGKVPVPYLVPYSASKFAVTDGSVALRIKAQRHSRLWNLSERDQE